MNARNMELLILLTAVMVVTVSPTFLLATHVDSDEWVKSLSGMTGGGAVFAAYKLWKGR